MDAPLYPPSAAYEAPEVLSQAMTTRDCSLAQFLADPKAAAILFEEGPAFKFTIATPQLKPHLDNMSPAAMLQFGVTTQAQLDRIDARLKTAQIMTDPRK